jgi:hypothetical protein
MDLWEVALDTFAHTIQCPTLSECLPHELLYDEECILLRRHLQYVLRHGTPSIPFVRRG